ncbi:MAG TPA: cytidine deaminase [Terracidiphilus sp.]|nr:cytidine deaminase [Terracidiphilus sp.]
MTGTRIDPSELENLMQAAKEAAEKSYSPYSRFKVGAALLLTSGEIMTGTNIENMSYGLTICAERAALAASVSRFGPTVRIAAVAITNLNGSPSPPCGACRQMLAEFILPNAPVVFPSADGLRTMTFRELLPLAFELNLESKP